MLTLEAELTWPEGYGSEEHNKLSVDSRIEDHNTVRTGVYNQVDKDVYSWNIHHYRYFCCNDRDNDRWAG